MRPKDPFVGREILDGQFQMIQRIGSGSMGSVYKATERKMNRMVAIKILHPRLSGRKDLASRFRREARAMSQLTHPNTVRVFLYEELDDGSLCIVMELLEGRILNQAVRCDGPMTLEKAVPILSQICGALQEAHELGIIHRDLKPENIFLCNQGGLIDYPKLLDFGLAKVTERQMGRGSVQVTQEGGVFGTPEFMSPEQAQGRHLDARSDIYSLAVVMFEVLTGRLPFAAQSPGEFVQKHVQVKPRTLAEAAPDRSHSPQLEYVIAKALEKRPDDRWQSAKEFASALEDVLQTNSAGGSPDWGRDNRIATLPGPPHAALASSGIQSRRKPWSLPKLVRNVAVQWGRRFAGDPDAVLPPQRAPLGIRDPSCGSLQGRPPPFEVPNRMGSVAKNPSVFLSYSHDTVEHAAKVRAVADALRKHGFESWTDQYLPELGPSEGWPAWMQRSVEDADWVLMVCTPSYRRRLEKRESSAVGRGALFEGHLLMQMMHDAGSRQGKLVPLLFDNTAIDSAIPLYLRSFRHFRIPGEFHLLVRALALPNGQAPEVEPAVVVPASGAEPNDLPGAWSALLND